jgi:methylated-DNA-[protein]-cysteine S-methyltransferase
MSFLVAVEMSVARVGGRLPKAPSTQAALSTHRRRYPLAAAGEVEILFEFGTSTPPSVSIECQLSACQRLGFGRGQFAAKNRRRGTVEGVFSMMQSTLQQRPSVKSTRRRGRSTAALLTAFSTDLGWMALAQSDEVLRGIVFGYATPRQAIDALARSLSRGAATPESVEVLDVDGQPVSIVDVIDRLKAYAAGDEVDFRDIAIDESHLTDFGRRIVRACRRIARGKTRSYGELASASGSPGAARAVGQVMAKNRYPLVVPCHRVLASSGRMGGFSAPQGLTMKRRLLEMEAITAAPSVPR